MNVQISLAAARVNANMTQEDVAKRLKVGKNTILAWEKGRSEPSASQAKELARIYNIPMDFIFFGSYPT